LESRREGKNFFYGWTEKERMLRRAIEAVAS
jgi:hypothetical protein